MVVRLPLLLALARMVLAFGLVVAFSLLTSELYGFFIGSFFCSLRVDEVQFGRTFIPVVEMDVGLALSEKTVGVLGALWRLCLALMLVAQRVASLLHICDLTMLGMFFIKHIFIMITLYLGGSSRHLKVCFVGHAVLGSLGVVLFAYYSAI